jgi:hypothetical protein
MSHNTINDSEPTEPVKNQETIAYLEANFAGSDVFKQDVRKINIANIDPTLVAENNGIESSIVVMVKAGQEVFAIVAVRKDKDSNQVSFVLSRVREGERGQIVDVMNKEQPKMQFVGSANFTDRQQPLDQSCSPNHFSVELSASNEIIVTDNGSQNGTQLFARHKDEPRAGEALPSGPLSEGAYLPMSDDLR